MNYILAYLKETLNKKLKPFISRSVSEETEKEIQHIISTWLSSEFNYKHDLINISISKGKIYIDYINPSEFIDFTFYRNQGYGMLVLDDDNLPTSPISERHSRWFRAQKKHIVFYHEWEDTESLRGFLLERPIRDETHPRSSVFWFGVTFKTKRIKETNFFKTYEETLAYCKDKVKEIQEKKENLEVLENISEELTRSLF